MRANEWRQAKSIDANENCSAFVERIQHKCVKIKTATLKNVTMWCWHSRRPAWQLQQSTPSIFFIPSIHPSTWQRGSERSNHAPLPSLTRHHFGAHQPWLVSSLSCHVGFHVKMLPTQRNDWAKGTPLQIALNRCAIFTHPHYQQIREIVSRCYSFVFVDKNNL